MKKIYEEIINDMYTQQETETNDVKLDNTRKRNIRMAGIISDYLKNISGRELIVTGGLSVEFHTEGHYTTQDIDLITIAEDELNEVLMNLGFLKKSKYWEHKKLEMILELVANVPFDGTFKEPKEFLTEDGFSVKFTTVNDMIMDRIRSAVQWEDKESKKWALILITQYKEELDLEYINKNLENNERNLFNDLLKITSDKDSFLARKNRIQEMLDNNKIIFTEYDKYREEKTYYIIITLDSSMKEEVGLYFGLLLSPNIGIMFYNEEEEEMELVDSQQTGKVLYDLEKKYGEPFNTIINFIKEG